MKEWLVTYQRMPTNYNQAERMVVEAESLFDAWVVAADALTRRGHLFRPPSFLTDEERGDFHSRFPCSGTSTTLLQSCLPYDPQPRGKVLSG
jgi:hypothetical protein